jgi:lipoprotein-releasing system permease protein
MGMEEFDSGLGLISIGNAEKLKSIDRSDRYSSELDNLDNARSIALELADSLGQTYEVTTWMDSHANFFKAIAMEKKVMFIILSLIILVAVINLISMLMMLVTDKQADIAILRTLGFHAAQHHGHVHGAGCAGRCGRHRVWCGFGLAALVAVASHREGHRAPDTGVVFLSPDVYYISEVPSKLDAYDVLWVALITFAFSLLATLYPAWRASRTQPAQALRYE